MPNSKTKSIISQVRSLYLIFLVTKYGKVDPRQPSFLGSHMSTSMRNLDLFKGNLTTMGGCRYGGRRDIGLVAPSSLISGYEITLKKEFSKCPLQKQVIMFRKSRLDEFTYL
jgi:hypothetical protein